MHLLLLANIFPPVVGGSATVYQEYCSRLAENVSVLAPWRDYRTGRPITGWRESDSRQPFPITRVELLRPRLLAKADHQKWRQAVEYVRDQRLRSKVLSLVSGIVAAG